MVDWTMFAAAAFAPVIVWVLWRLQAASVNHVLRGGLYKLLRNQKPLYSVVSWFGVLLHEISHAIFLLLGGHGIRNFKVGVDAGHVTPKQVRTGPFGLLTFLAAAMAPIYTGPGVILLLLAVLVTPGLLAIHVGGTGLAPAWDALTGMAATFAEDLALGLLGLDLATGSGIAVFLLAVLAMPAARPSFVKKEGRDEGDIAVVRMKVKQNPWTILIVFLVLYALYFVLVPLAPGVYWTFFQVLWAIAITGILLAVVGGAMWYLTAYASRASLLVAWVPFALAAAAQVVPRLMDVPVLATPVAMNVASLALFAITALLLPTLMPKRGLAGF